MNKKGFTLVELLAVIVIIGILGYVAVVSYSALVKKNQLRTLEIYEDTMYSDAMTLLTTNVSLIPRNGETAHFTLAQLKTAPINNPRNSNDLCLESYVDVTRDDYNKTDSKTGVTTHVDSFTYKVCLRCLSSDYDNCVTYPKPAN